MKFFIGVFCLSWLIFMTLGRGAEVDDLKLAIWCAFISFVLSFGLWCLR